MAKDTLPALLDKASELYFKIYYVVDTTKLDLPITAKDNETLLQSYLRLYGRFKNRHGDFNHAEDYESFREKVEWLKAPERECIVSVVKRIEEARAKIEEAIRNLSPEEIAKFGYTLEQNNGKLVVYLESDS